MNLVEGSDSTPTTQAQTAFVDSQKALRELIAKWNELKAKDVKAVNEQLRQANLSQLSF